jgi:hypothetical protein
MNCENYQVLLSDFVDGALSAEDCTRLELHLSSCPGCKDARNDLSVIVDFCREQRGVYDPVPNERAMWLRISNLIEAETGSSNHIQAPSQDAGWFFRLMHRSFSFPQLAGAVGAAVIVVTMVTAFSVYRLTNPAPLLRVTDLSASISLKERYNQQQQTIAYWNQRVEMNKARWSPQMRETFDRNMGVIDAAVTDSMNQLQLNPHDAISEDILNEALNDKVALLKEFSDL